MATKTFLAMALSLMILFASGALTMAQDRPGMGGDMAEKRWKELDTNDDGKISLKEQLADCQKRCKDRFNKIDANKDGFITKDEDQAAIKQFREMGRQRMEDKGSRFMQKGD